MTELLIKLFVKDYDNVGNLKVRSAYGSLTSIIGIACNILLFIMKFIVGLVLNSIAVMADAINNLSDAASSVISLIGVRLASKPADKEHPFGHGRIEYLSAFIISFIIMEVGLSFFKESFNKIKNPDTIHFQLVSVIILTVSIGIKIWLAYLNRKIGMRINSKVMKATAADAIGDVFTTTATIASILIFYITGYNLDGIIGMLVAVVVMYAGFSIAKDTIEPLIGEAVDPAVYHSITDFVESYKGILGTHDLIVHNYGPSKSMASIHAEVPNNIDIETSHEIIDKIEQDAIRQLGTFLVIHMDPIETENETIMKAKKVLLEILAELDEKVTMHDFRMVDGEKHCNLIFDLVVPHEYTKEARNKLKSDIEEEMKKVDVRYEFVITVEESYISVDI